MPAKIFQALKGDNAWGLVLALAAFCVYLTTLGPSIGFIDAGELAAVAHTFGVAHPTGYPLFTLVAGAFSHLPIGDSVVWRLNLFAALCCAASLFVFFHVFLDLLRRVFRAARALDARLAAATAAAILAFSRTFWSQATGVEVYSLHLLMLALILFFFLRALPDDGFATGASADPSARRGRWLLFAFVLGLGFTNHMTTLLVLPALAVAYFTAHGWKRREAWRVAGLALPFFILGLSLYLYLPWRASAWPELNWGAIVDRESFYWHVSGKQYSGWMFSSLEPAGRNFALFLRDWPAAFAAAALVPAFIGWIALFRRARRLFAFSLLLFFGCLAYAVNYDISDVVNYFLLAHVATAVAVAFGALFLLDRSREGSSRALALTLCAFAAALPPVLHYRAVDESGNYAVEDYARELLGSAEPNAVILTFEWDVFVAGAWYLQAVEGYRTDVLVVDRELLRRAWYLRKLRHDHPEFTGPSAAEIAAFEVELRKFDLDLPYAPQVIQGAFENMIRSLLQNAGRVRPVYVTSDIERNYIDPLQMAPAGALLRLYPQGGSVPVVPRRFTPRPFPKENAYFDMVRKRYAGAYVNQALFYASINEYALAETFLRKAIETDPTHSQARGYLLRLQSLQAAPSQAPSSASP